MQHDWVMVVNFLVRLQPAVYTLELLDWLIKPTWTFAVVVEVTDVQPPGIYYIHCSLHLMCVTAQLSDRASIVLRSWWRGRFYQKKK